MKTVCAWCRKIIKEGTETIVSHGICKKCSDIVIAIIEEQEKKKELEKK